jgi:hypothetical protein
VRPIVVNVMHVEGEFALFDACVYVPLASAPLATLVVAEDGALPDSCPSFDLEHATLPVFLGRLGRLLRFHSLRLSGRLLKIHLLGRLHFLGSYGAQVISVEANPEWANDYASIGHSLIIIPE